MLLKTERVTLDFPPRWLLSSLFHLRCSLVLSKGKTQHAQTVFAIIILRPCE
jgi:hypothetical protein